MSQRPRSNTPSSEVPNVYLVPKDTDAVLQRHLVKSSHYNHLGLLMTRYAPNDAIKNGEGSGEWIKKSVASHSLTNFEVDRKYKVTSLVTAMHLRWLETINTTARQIGPLQSLTRLAVGLGGKGALEIGLTLHYTTGLPYIPGSALKGLCRSFALFTIAAKFHVPVLQGDDLVQWGSNSTRTPTPLAIFDDLLAAPIGNEKQQKAQAALFDKMIESAKQYAHVTTVTFTLDQMNADSEAQQFRRIFGSQDASGVIIFHDAVISKVNPQSSQLLEVDVMTPHYKSYYDSEGSKAPGDNDNPTPITFLTVPAHTTFAFAVGLRHGCADDGAVDHAAEWLTSGLCEFGIGAKTHAGYGLFTRG